MSSFLQLLVSGPVFRSGLRNALVFGGVLGLSLCSFGADTGAAPAAVAGAPTVWRLRDAARVDGHATEILGAPQFVGKGAEESLFFNGSSDGIFVPVNPIAGWGQFTIEILFKPDGTGQEEQRFFHIQDLRQSRVLLETRVKDGQWALDTFLFDSAGHRLPLLDRTKAHPTDRWTWAALVYDGKTMTSYVDGVKELSGEVTFSPMTTGRTSVGVRQNKVYWYKGCIREVKFSPSALSADLLQRPAAP